MCGNNLKSAARLVAILNIGIFIGIIAFFTGLSFMVDDLESRQILWFFAAIFLLPLIFATILLIGVVKENIILIKMWVYFHYIILLLSVVGLVVKVLYLPSFRSFVIGLGWILGLHSLINIVSNYVKELEIEKAENSYLEAQVVVEFRSV